MSIEKRISQVFNRYDSVDYLEVNQKGNIISEQNSELALDKITEILALKPETIQVLEKLSLELNKCCPGGTKKSLQVIVDNTDKLALYADDDHPDTLFIGDRCYADLEWLVIKLDLPLYKAPWAHNQVHVPLKAAIEQFATTIPDDFYRVIAVEGVKPTPWNNYGTEPPAAQEPTDNASS